ncbi:MAG: PDZ domain-containing protein [Bacteroidota bacterium]
MKKFELKVILFLTILFYMTTTTSAATAASISYNVSFPEAQAHYADVEMKITGLKQTSLELKMPVWTPGSYLVREFAKNIESLSVTAGGKNLPATKTRKNIWTVKTTGISAVTVTYRVYAFEISVRTSFIDNKYAFLSSPDIFLYPGNMLNSPATIHIKPYKKWDKVTTSLEKINGDPFTCYSPNFDILFDSPIEVGNQEVFNFNVDGVAYEVAMTGGGTYDDERIKQDFTKIIREQVAIFGENPNKHYTFIVHNYLKGGGGLEHLSSTVLGASRDGYSTEKNYQSFLSLASHEHFHLWNVKRLRPIVLGPFDYDNEAYTTNLWIAEGFTAYYQDVIVHRTKLYPTSNFLALMGAQISNLENQPGLKVQTLSASSYDAWIKAYRPNENSANTGISYYTKGALVGLLLDLEIINNSKGKYALDDVMKYMYNEYYKVKKRGYTDAEFKLGLEKFAGKKLTDLYADYINGLTPLPYNKYLAYAGYKITDSLATSNNAELGITRMDKVARLIVTGVTRGSAAWVDGINVNDEILTIDGVPVPEKGNLIPGKKPGDVVMVKLLRDGLTLNIPVTLLKSKRQSFKFEELPNPTAEQLAVRKKWLKLD